MEKIPKISNDQKESPNKLRSKLDRTINYGTDESLMLLFNEGMNIDQEDHEGRTALQMMAAKGNKKMVEWLIEKGANINKVFMYHDRLPKSALDAAQETGRKEIELILLQHGAKTGEELKS